MNTLAVPYPSSHFYTEAGKYSIILVVSYC